MLEVGPALRREVDLAGPDGVGHDVLGVDHHVGAQVHDLAQLDPALQPRLLGVGHGDALVEAVVRQLFEVLRADVVVERVPHMDVVPEVEAEEVPVGAERQHADHHQQPIAQLALPVGAPLLGQPDPPADERHRRQRQAHLEPRAGVVLPPGELPEPRLDDDRRRRVGDVQLGRERRRRAAVGLKLGDRVGPVADRLADLEEAHRRRVDGGGPRAEAVPLRGDDVVDLDQKLERLRLVHVGAEDLVGVVGVGLEQERRDRTDRPEVVGQRPGGRLEDHADRRVPLRPLGRGRVVRRQVEIAADVLAPDGDLAREQVVGRAVARRLQRLRACPARRQRGQREPQTQG